MDNNDVLKVLKTIRSNTTFIGVFALVIMITTIAQCARAEEAPEVSPFGYTLGAPLPEDTTLDSSGYMMKLDQKGKWHVLVQGTKAFGICEIKGLQEVSTGGHGVEARTAFDNLEERLTELYGQPTDENKRLRPNPMWGGEHEWVMSLITKERMHQSIWKLDYAVIVANLSATELGGEANVAVLYGIPEHEECKKDAERSSEVQF